MQLYGIEKVVSGKREVIYSFIFKIYSPNTSSTQMAHVICDLGAFQCEVSMFFSP